MKNAIVLLATFAFVMPAAAQYYEPPPPPPGYYPPRPERRYEPRYDVPYGRHCEAFLRTGQRLFCRIVEPKPLGESCACPPPPPPPGYRPGPFIGGQTVR